MNNHVWRPLLVVLALVAVILLARVILVPDDFGVGEQGYMYGYHRQGNEGEWKTQAIKMRGAASCAICHPRQQSQRLGTLHERIECENCHDPAGAHPQQPQKLAIYRDRDLCLRCHALLVYPGSNRATLRGIDPQQHNPGQACVDCHNPHRPNLEEM